MSQRHTVLSMFPDLVADKYTGPIPLSVQQGTNGDVVHQFRHIYFADDRSVVDLTYGDAGGWWTRHRPTGLVVSTDDFTNLPYADGEFGTVCYDPPYVRSGGAATSVTTGVFRKRYGIEIPRSTGDLLHLILAGSTEASRITNRVDGFLCVKAMDYADNGFCDWTYAIHRHLTDLGMFLHDEIIHNAGTGPGGHNVSVPKRARRSHSKLLIFTWSRR